jgi:hypothetical protein
MPGLRGPEVDHRCQKCGYWEARHQYERREGKTSAPDDSDYARLTPKPRAVIMSWGLTFTLGNVVKYIARAGYKKGSSALSDLKKARRYIDYEIERLEEGK